MQQTGDPRLYRICRHYINTKRSEITPDREGNHDLTDEVVDYLKRSNTAEAPCDPGAAWWNNWINAPANSEIPTLDKLVKDDPAAGYDQSNFNARMMRPALNIDFEMPDRPGILITSAEVDFLKAEGVECQWRRRTALRRRRARLDEDAQRLLSHCIGKDLRRRDQSVHRCQPARQQSERNHQHAGMDPAHDEPRRGLGQPAPQRLSGAQGPHKAGKVRE